MSGLDWIPFSTGYSNQWYARVTDGTVAVYRSFRGSFVMYYCLTFTPGKVQYIQTGFSSLRDAAVAAEKRFNGKETGSGLHVSGLPMGGPASTTTKPSTDP